MNLLNKQNDIFYKIQSIREINQSKFNSGHNKWQGYVCLEKTGLKLLSTPAYGIRF